MQLKKLFLIGISIISGYSFASANLVLDGKSYSVDSIYRREVGPGIFHTRYRIPDYPLNVYTIEMDLNNKYNKIETTLPNDKIGTQETLASAYSRHKAEGKKPIAGANASFWVVSGHGEAWQFMLGTNFGGCVLDGKILTETNLHNNLAYMGRGVIGVDTDKKLWANSMSWYGEVKSARWDKPLELIQLNKIQNEGELAIFTKEFGTDKAIRTTDTADNIFLDVDEGQSWGVNKDMTATVKAISLDKSGETLRDYDICLCGSGDYKPYLRQLQVGDKVTLNHAWTIRDTDIKPNFENLVEGNQLIMKDGEVTPENDTDGYCSMTYSRCGYGVSQDGKKLFIMVIDMSLSAYGNSIGCPSRIMSQILKTMGCWNAVNMDAGGSAQMMVDGSVVNKTTEGTPRAVSTSWLLYSTAPNEDNEISRLEFDDVNLVMPTKGIYSPKVLGYNKYDELIDQDVQGITYTCDAAIGSCNGNVIKAGDKAGYGKVTAHLGNIEVSKPITTIASSMSIRISPNILIDSFKEYPIEVVSTLNKKEYKYDPADLDWSIEDPSVVSISNGILKGLKNGTTKISCHLDEFSDETNVTVETAENNIIGQDWSKWSLSGSGVNSLSINSEGVLNFNFTNARSNKINMTTDSKLYSLPDRVAIEFTSTMPISNIQVNVAIPQSSATLPIICNNNGAAYEANQKYAFDLDLSSVIDMKDLINYPIQIKSMVIYLPSTNVTKGEKTINFNHFDAIYNNYSSAETNLATNYDIMIYPNPVCDGTISVSSPSDNVNVNIYSLEGKLLISQKVSTNGGSATMQLENLSKGVYLIQTDNENISKTEKIIIR